MATAMVTTTTDPSSRQFVLTQLPSCRARETSALRIRDVAPGTQLECASRMPRQRGMTLLEIMVVLAILALVMGLLVGPRVRSAWREAQIRTTRIQVHDLAYGAFPAWQLDHGSEPCPAELRELAAYAKTRKLVDSWGVALGMRCGPTAPPEEDFGALSFGPDQREETPDDIRSWDDATRQEGRK